MQKSDFNDEERTFSFKEIADQLGVSEEEIISFAQQEGLLDPNGMPTEFAIQEGLLVDERNIDLN